MQSTEYKSIVRGIVQRGVKAAFPGLKPAQISKVSIDIARAVHARLYGANVDNVDSPLFRDGPQFEDAKQPTMKAADLLKEGDK